MFAAVVGRDPDWAALPARLPRRARDVLRCCLQKDPARRLRDIADARLELEDAENGDVPAAATAQPRGRRWRSVLLWSVAAVRAS